MTRIKYLLSAVLVVAASSGVAVNYHSAPSLGEACACDMDSVAFDPSLPTSHPANRCSLQNKASNESWWAWLAGDSRSAEYHFIDLLELISSSSEPKKPIAPEKS
ncbi:hypothetical protein ACFSJ3_11740 [Corallincola platygyrae]|uniref:Uncharacterized protein n=1 Tax=Corallincola platygyrae TaxID=1193278 RepID=A0ABW4XQW3_9GAMM